MLALCMAAPAIGQDLAEHDAWSELAARHQAAIGQELPRMSGVLPVVTEGSDAMDSLSPFGVSPTRSLGLASRGCGSHAPLPTRDGDTTRQITGVASCGFTWPCTTVIASKSGIRRTGFQPVTSRVGSATWTAPSTTRLRTSSAPSTWPGRSSGEPDHQSERGGDFHHLQGVRDVRRRARDNGRRGGRARGRLGRTRTLRPLAGGEDGGQVRGPEQPHLPRPSIGRRSAGSRREPGPFVSPAGLGSPGRRARKHAAATAGDALDGALPARGARRGSRPGSVDRAGRRRPAVNLIPLIRPKPERQAAATRGRCGFRNGGT